MRANSSSSGDSSISMAAVQTIVNKLKFQYNRTSTRENYYKVWKMFNEFFIKLDCKPQDMGRAIDPVCGVFGRNKEEVKYDQKLHFSNPKCFER